MQQRISIRGFEILPFRQDDNAVTSPRAGRPRPYTLNVTRYTLTAVADRDPRGTNCFRASRDQSLLMLSMLQVTLNNRDYTKLSLFSKRIKLRVSECNANWFVITQRTEATSLKANTAKPGGSLDRGGVL